MDQKTEQSLRQVFKQFNRFMMLMWRLGLGRWFNVWPEVSGQVMVIAHTGRQSGLRRYTPVNFAEVEGDLYCVAGFGAITDWYRNILRRPQVEIWMPDGWWAGIAQDVSDDKNRTELMRGVMIGSGFAAPLFGVDPRKLSDEELAQVTASYRLVKIQRQAACTGPGGPGELAWIWQVATFALLAKLLFMRKRKRS